MKKKIGIFFLVIVLVLQCASSNAALVTDDATVLEKRIKWKKRKQKRYFRRIEII